MYRNLIIAVFIFLILFLNVSFPQTIDEFYQAYKIEKAKLNSFYSSLQMTPKLTNIFSFEDINKVKFNLLNMKTELVHKNLSTNTLLYHKKNKTLSQNFDLLDFHLYDTFTGYYRVICRLQNKSEIYANFVKLTYNFYKNGRFISTDYAYIDYETYGYSGMLPYHISFFESFTNKVDFDDITFELSYYQENGTGDICWDQLMEIEQIVIEKEYPLQKWSGQIKNKANYSFTFPLIYGCVFKDENMIDLISTFLDLKSDKDQNDSLFIEYISIANNILEKIILRNGSFQAIDISGWTINTSDGSYKIQIPSFTVLPAQCTYSLSILEFNIKVNNDSLLILLQDKDGDIIDIWSIFSQCNSDVRIYSVITTPTEKEEIKLINNSTTNIEISGWSIGDKNDPFAYKIPEQTIINNNEIVTFSRNMLGFQIDDSQEIIFLKDQNGLTVDTWSSEIQITGDIRIYSVTRTPTTEEQVTLKNYSFFLIDLAGWTLGDKNDPEAHPIRKGTILNPGETLKFNHANLGFGINDAGEILYLKDSNNNLIDIWHGPGILNKTFEERFKPFSTAKFESYISLPAEYDTIKYYLSYSLSSLDGTGNLAPNWPQFTEIACSNKVEIEYFYQFFVIDHENDQIQVTVDWDDNSIIDWSRSYFSGSLATINHIYNQTGIYTLKTKSKDKNGLESTWSKSVKINIIPTSSISIDPEMQNDINFILNPENFSLKQNYPNPFNPQTTIVFGLPEASEVSIAIYNVNGQVVAELFNGIKAAGFHQVTWDAANASAGIYLIKMQTAEFVEIRKCLLIK
ncbi:lamin tail domain-containing protein [candidate division KSB1 bacterium]|nr:lamin tail domain-containing protein [candidate division KSB1 bacterium]